MLPCCGVNNIAPYIYPPLHQDSSVIEALNDPDIKKFIADHGGDDVARLGLVKMPDGWPRALILDQIRARQKAAAKVPDWAGNNDLILPRPDVMEQCSSTATARFKASLVGGARFIDLTAGAGVDCAALAQRFDAGIAVERDPFSAACLRHNLPRMGAQFVQVVEDSAESFIQTANPCDLIFIDPQRRTAQTRGLFRLEDTSPPVLDLLPMLLSRARAILLKTSPVLDIDLACGQLGRVCAVHVVEWRGECKELLFLIARDHDGAPMICAHKIDDSGIPVISHSATRDDEGQESLRLSAPGRFLYEPGPAFMKAGLFATMGARFKMGQLHPATHLYSGDEWIADFPGRGFAVEAILPADRKALRAALPSGQANLALRNFPGTVEDLKKRLTIRDGGDHYLFACTLGDGQRRLILCKKP